MDLMARRFSMLAQQKPVPTEYIADGLVLWLDGIDQGDTPNCWIDKVAGHIFTANNGVTFGTNKVSLDSSLSQNLVNEGFVTPRYDEGTFEIVFDSFAASSSSGIIYAAGETSKFSLRPYNTGVIRFRCSAGVNSPSIRVEYNQIIKTMSFNVNVRLVNGVQPVASDQSTNIGGPQNGKNYIGSYPNDTTFFNGSIHAIRMYNRLLTEDEMLNNQRVDNKRFNLGLSI